jgi:hypothetical protein
MGDTHGAVAAERVVISNLELVGKLLGTLISRSEVSHNLLVSPDYVRLRPVVIQALRPHTAAARDVNCALAELEAEAAREISSKPVIEATPCQ